MFKENQKHRQIGIKGMVHRFKSGMLKRLDESRAPIFHKFIFEKIDERRYAVLFSSLESRPNFTVNIWVGMEIRKTRIGKLRMRLNNRLRYAAILMAIGINFSRLLAYYRKTQSGLSTLLASFILLLMCLAPEALKKTKIPNSISVQPILVNEPVFG